MAFSLGYNSAVYIGETKIGEVNSFGPGIAMETIDTREYGEASPQPVVVTRTFTAEISGHLDLSDPKQLQIVNTVLDSTSTDPSDIAVISDFRFYESAAHYWGLLNESADHFTISNFAWTPDLSGLVTFSCSVTATGLMQRVAV
jgi:hypothetical protein